MGIYIFWKVRLLKRYTHTLHGARINCIAKRVLTMQCNHGNNAMRWKNMLSTIPIHLNETEMPKSMLSAGLCNLCYLQLKNLRELAIMAPTGGAKLHIKAFFCM